MFPVRPLVSQELRKYGIRYVVAPYEADAQIAYLLRNGIAHAAISEDSDLIPYGCQLVSVWRSRAGTCCA
jgi:exonuclease-1